MHIRTKGVKCLALLVVLTAFVTLLVSRFPSSHTHPYKQQQRGDKEIRDKKIRGLDPNVTSSSLTELEHAWILDGKLEEDKAGKTRLELPGNVNKVKIDEPGSRNEELEMKNDEKTDIIQDEKLQNEKLDTKFNEKLNKIKNGNLESPNEELEMNNNEKLDIMQDEELVSDLELDVELGGKVNKIKNGKLESPNEELEVTKSEETDVIQDENIDAEERRKSNEFKDENLNENQEESRKIESKHETRNESYRIGNQNENINQLENKIENYQTGKINENRRNEKKNMNREENHKTGNKNLDRNKNQIETGTKNQTRQIPVYFDPLENVTPKDFIEVQKVNPKIINDSKKVSKKKKAQRITNVLGYSPKELQERAQTFPENSTMRAFLREQERRVKHINSSCHSLQPSLAEIIAGSRGPPLGLMSVAHVIYDRINQLTYCPVYKAASTSWTYMLLQLAGLWTPDMKNQPIQKLCKTFYPKLSGPSIPVVTKNTTHFLMVRHPLERLLSCYRDKFQNASKDYYYRLYGEKMIKRFRKSLSTLPIEQILKYQQEVRVAMRSGSPINLPDNPFANPVGPTFPEFVQHVAYTKQDDEHWRPYVTLCSPCLLTYEFVLRFESLQEERELFLEYINRADDAKLRWDNHNQRGDTKTLACDFYSQLSLSQIDLLIEKYQKDLVLFEYDPEMYRKCAWDYVEVR